MVEHEPNAERPDSPALQSTELFATQTRQTIFQPGDVMGDFTIVREISAGGMGVVYLAEQKSLGRRIALKVLPHQYAGSEMQIVRLHREAKAAAKLRHPNIVQVYMVGEHLGTHYIAMEYVEGIDLAHELQGRLTSLEGGLSLHEAAGSVERTVSIIAQLADALEYAHSHGIIHRDLKPRNILIDRGDTPRLTDFGLAKDVTEASLSQAGELAGTPAYMSPEQALSKRVPIDHRTDIYSLGVVLYEMLTLNRPFQGRSQQEILYNISFRAAPPIRRLNPRIARDLRVICEKAIEKNPDDRFQSAGEFAADLRRFLNHEEIVAKPPSVPRRVAGRVRRHRSAVVAAVIAVLGLTIGGLLYGDAQRRAAAACRLTVTSSPSGAEVHVARFPDAADTMGKPRLIGTTPLEDSALEPGRYRVIVVATDGRFAETDVRFFDPAERASVSLKLFQTSEVTKNMVLIEGGAYELMNPRDGPFEPSGRIDLAPFYIDTTEVTNGEYLEYMDQTGVERPRCWMDAPDDEFLRRPVVALYPHEMEAYARWHGKRLPSAIEWEAACRGKTGRRYPWGETRPSIWPEVSQLDIRTGDLPDDHRQFDLYRRYTVPCRSQPELCTPEGVFHMAGNVGEMTSSWDLILGNAVIRKGGSWLDHWEELALWKSLGRPGQSWSFVIGFRCARSAAAPSREID